MCRGAPRRPEGQGSSVTAQHWRRLRDIELRARAVDGHDAILNWLQNFALLQRYQRRLVQVPRCGTGTDSLNPLGDTAAPHCGMVQCRPLRLSCRKG